MEQQTIERQEKAEVKTPGTVRVNGYRIAVTGREFEALDRDGRSAKRDANMFRLWRWCSEQHGRGGR